MDASVLFKAMSNQYATQMDIIIVLELCRFASSTQRVQ